MGSKRYYGKGRKKPNVMNGLESRYAEYLENKKQIGEIVWYAYEPIKFNLAKLSTYTPDFLVLTNDNELQVHEVKGFWLDNARTKVKISAELFPLRFFGVQWDRKTKEWVFEEF
jgi:hypothetical protein